MTEEDEIYGGPFTVDDTANPVEMGITKAMAARALAEPGWPYDKASTYWRNLASRGLIHPYYRKVSDPRPTFLYRFDQVLIAAVLFRMSEAGFIGDTLFAKAAGALNVWNMLDLMPQHLIDAGERPVYPAANPATWVVQGYASGMTGFDFEFVTFRSKDKHGFPDHRGRIHHRESSTGTDWHMGDNYAPRSVWSLELDPILKHLLRIREEVA